MKYDIFKKSLYGGMSGFISTTIVYPFDTLRTILQQSKSVNKLHIIKSIRPISLYNGYLFNLSFVIPEKALKIGVNDYLVNLNKNRYKSELTNHIISGSTAGFIQSFITTPAELIKIRKQVGNYKNYTDILKSTKNIYRGLQYTMLRDVPFTGVFFPIYYYLNKQLHIKTEFIKNIISGLGAGISATVIATPADVIKTRFQLSDKITIKKIINDISKQGYKTLFKGIFPRIICISSLYSLTMASFELQKKYFI